MLCFLLMDTAVERIGVTAHAGRIAPLFDAARRLEVYEVRAEGAERAGSMELGGLTPAQRAARLAEQAVTTVLCGAISAYAHSALATAGVRALPWVCGPVEGVLDAYLHGGLGAAAWQMPGCRGRGGRWRRGRRGRGPGRGGWC